MGVKPSGIARCGEEGPVAELRSIVLCSKSLFLSGQHCLCSIFFLTCLSSLVCMCVLHSAKAGPMKQCLSVCVSLSLNSLSISLSFLPLFSSLYNVG